MEKPDSDSPPGPLTDELIYGQRCWTTCWLFSWNLPEPELAAECAGSHVTFPPPNGGAAGIPLTWEPSGRQSRAAALWFSFVFFLVKTRPTRNLFVFLSIVFRPNNAAPLFTLLTLWCRRLSLVPLFFCFVFLYGGSYAAIIHLLRSWSKFSLCKSTVSTVNKI